MAVGTNEDVLELEVAMDYALRMDVCKPFAQIVVPLADRLFVNRTRLNVGKGFRLARLVQHEVHDEIGLASLLIRAEVGDLDDSRMAELREEPALRLETPTDLRIVLLVGEELYRVTGAEARIFRLVDLAHSALTEKANNVIVANRH